MPHHFNADELTHLTVAINAELLAYLAESLPWCHKLKYIGSKRELKRRQGCLTFATDLISGAAKVGITTTIDGKPYSEMLGAAVAFVRTVESVANALPDEDGQVHQLFVESHPDSEAS